MPLQVEIVTRERRLLNTQADVVILPGELGQMAVLEGHAPLLSTLEIGEIVLQTGDEREYIAVHGGVVEVRPDKVTVLTDLAEQAGEIDIGRAEAARERARLLLDSTPPPQRRSVMVTALKKSTWRIRVAQRWSTTAPGSSSQINKDLPR